MKTYPVQTRQQFHGSAKVNETVYLAAYEVYSHVYGSQQALLEGECRGGFSAGELIAFLYARGFPKKEWQQRIDEAFTKMEQL